MARRRPGALRQSKTRERIEKDMCDYCTDYNCPYYCPGAACCFDYPDYDCMDCLDDPWPYY